MNTQKQDSTGPQLPVAPAALSQPTPSSAQVLVRERARDDSFFTDLGARAVWAAVRELDEGLKHELLDLLAAELALPESRTDPSDVRVARAVSALREAHRKNEERGREHLEQGDYRSLRAEMGEGLGWPADSSIRRWLGGGWEYALRSACLPTPDGGVVAIAELGAAYSREECLQAVRDYLAEPGALAVPDIHSVINWARRPDVRSRAGRRPRSQSPYDRLFGSWNAVLSEVGVVRAGSPTGAAVGGRESGVSAPPRAARYTSEEIYAALREVAGRLEHSPKMHEYFDERLIIFQEEQALGLRPRSMVSSSVILRVFSSWDDALVDAGLSPVQGRRNARRSDQAHNANRYSEEEFLAAIQRAFQKMGHPFTSTAYIGWRRRTLVGPQADGAGSGSSQRIPGFPAITRHFGTWASSCECRWP
jgi:hypothetical protein